MVIIPPTGNLRSQVTISGSGDRFFKISDVRVGGVYTSGITGWEPTGLSSGASGDPTGNAVYGGLDILVSGTSAEYEVVNKNTIQFTVPSVGSVTGLQPKDQWIKYGYPAPVTVISSPRNVTGYASGMSGEHFTAIPEINYLSPLSGISGETAYIIGDGLLSVSGLTLLNTTGFTQNTSGYWQEPTGVTGVGFTGQNVNNIFIYQSVTGIYANTTGDVTVYLPFTKINNTGISFELPSGNFYGHFQVLSSGNVKSNPSLQKIKPNIRITGCSWLPDDPCGNNIGFSGQPMTISGNYFLPELMHWTQGQFLNSTGTYDEHAGYLVEFAGEGASGLFLPKSGAELFALTGYTPATTRTGPVKIKQNENIDGDLTGYYISSEKYYVYPFAPQMSVMQGGLDSNGINLWPSFLLETGNYDSGVYASTGSYGNCCEQSFSVGEAPEIHTQTGYLTSGLSGVVSGVTGFNTILDTGFSGYVVTGLASGTGVITGYISGLVVRPSGYIQIPVTGILESGIMTGITYSSGVPINPPVVTQSMPMYNSSSSLGYRRTNLGVQNWYMSGVSGCDITGIDPPPITIWYPTAGPNIQTCMEDYQAKKERGDSPIYFLSGCEQAFLLYFSGHWEYLEVNSPNFQPDLINCFLTSQVLSSGLAGHNQFSGIDRTAASGRYDNHPCAQMAAIAAGHPGGVPIKTPPIVNRRQPPWPPTEPPCDPYTQDCDDESGGGPDAPSGPGGPMPPPWESESSEKPTPTPPPFGPCVNSEQTNRYGQEAARTHMPGEWAYPPEQGSQICATIPSANITSSALKQENRVLPLQSPYKNSAGTRVHLRGNVGVFGSIQWFFVGGLWSSATIWENGAPRYARSAEEVENAPLGYRRIALRPPVEPLPKTMQRQSPSPNPPLQREGSAQAYTSLIQSPNPRGTSNKTNCGGSKPGTHSSWPPPGGGPTVPTIDPAFPGTPESPGLQPPLPRNNQPELEHPGSTVGEAGVPRGGPRNTLSTVFRPGEAMPIPRAGGAGNAGLTQYPNIGARIQIGNTVISAPVAGSPYPTTSAGGDKPPVQGQNVLAWPPESYLQQDPGGLGNPGLNPADPPFTTVTVPPLPPKGSSPVVGGGHAHRTLPQLPDPPAPWNSSPPTLPSNPTPLGPVILPPAEQECGVPNHCIEGHPSFPLGCDQPPRPTWSGEDMSQTISGMYILPDPVIDSCSSNNCYGHMLYTGSTGYIAYDSNIVSSGVVYESSPIPYHDWNSQSLLSAIFYGASGTAELATGAFFATGVEQNFEVNNSGSIHFCGGFLQTESSSGLDLSNEPSWSVEFWINPAIDHTGLEHNPYYSKDIALFGFSGEYTGVSGNSFFHIGYTRESGVGGITNTVKPYIDLSGIQLESKYLWTGWFPESGYNHCAIIKDVTGYSFHYNGCRYGEVIPTGLIDPHLPKGRTKFYFGGLCTGNFEPFSTGYNQCFSPAITGSPDVPGRPIRTDLQLGLEDNFIDSGKYFQTITTGGFPLFVNDNPKCGSQSLLVTGLDYVQTTGSNFNYGTGDFTVECWIKPSGATQGLGIGGNGMQMLWALGQSNNNFATGNGLAFILNNYTNRFRLCFDYAQTNLAVDLIPPYNDIKFKKGEWNHIALCREDTSFFSYVNGAPAGAMQTEDLAANYNTKNIYTGMPVIDATGQQVFLGGGVSGHLSYFKVDDTGLLFETQPVKWTPKYHTESGWVDYNFIQDPTIDPNYGVAGIVVLRGVQRHTIHDAGLAGYQYTVKEGAAVECQAKVVAKWGGTVNMASNGRMNARHGMITNHWVYNRHGSTGVTGTYEHAQSFPIGGTAYTSVGGPRGIRPVRRLGQPSPAPTYVYGVHAKESDFGIPKFTPNSMVASPGCFVEKILTTTITGVTKGDTINFYSPQWCNTLVGQPDTSEVVRTVNNAWMHQGGNSNNQVFIKELIFKECPLVNYHGQIDQFIISSGAKYSSLPTTGIYDSGWLNSDLGEKIYIDEINVTKRALFTHENGKYTEPTTAPTVDAYTDAMLNFETPSDLNNIVADGITGDGPYTRTFTTTAVSSPANNVEFATGEGKFGTYAMRFPTGSTTYNRANTLVAQNITLGIEDFTAEMWIKPSGTAYSTTLTGVGVDNGIKRQTLLSFGTTGSGFNFFLSGGEGGQCVGIDLFNGGRITGVTPDYSTGISGFDPGVPSQRMYAFTSNSAQSSGSYFGYWNSGDWNHVAFTRQNRDIKAYINGYFAGMINYTGISIEYNPNVYVSTGIAGVTLCSGLDIQSGPLTLGGGSLEAIGYEGLMDGFSLEVGHARYTGVFVAPRPFVSCNHRNELVCHADGLHNFYQFFDAHCCPTGDDALSWGDSITVDGQYFFDITGVLVGENRTPATDWFRSDQTSLHVTVPEESVSGPITIIGTGFAPVTGCNFEIKAPQMKIIRFTPISGYPNEVVSVYGQSLHLAQKLYVSGFSNKRALLPFTGVGTTGINFSIPNSGAPYTPIQLFSETGMQMTTGLLNILSSGIQTFTPLTGVYGETISFSGNNFEENVDIVMFPAYQGEDISSSSYVQTRYVSGIDITYIDNTGIETKVPHELVRGKPIVSGWNDTTEIVKAPMEFTPMPTISGIETVETQVGCQFRITGINASHLVPLLGFTGNSLQPYTAGDGVIEFVANTGDSHAMRNNSYPPVTEIGIDRHNSGNYSKYFYFGKFELDKTHIDASAGYVTGYTVITGTFNDQVVGTGNPFLISRHEIFNNELLYTFDDYNGVSGVDIDLLRQDFVQLRETYALQNINNIIGDQTIISGRIPVIVGVSPTRGDGGVQLHISGKNALNVTGVKFIADSDPSVECHMDSGIFIPQTTEIPSYDPNALTQTTQTITGWHFSSMYTGDGQYIDVGNQLQLFKIYPCEELRIYGSVSIELMYDPDICITGAC